MSGQHIGRRNLLLAAAASVAVPGRAAWSQAEPPIHVVKGRGCECCEAWVDYLREQGFTVTDEVSMGTLLIRFKMDQGVPALPAMPGDAPGMGGDTTTWADQPVVLVNRDGSLTEFAY